MGLFGRARDAFQGWSAPEPAEPQSYRLTCPEGHTLRGLRTEGFQALRCPSCGEGVFVLPISPLPEPTPPANRPRRPTPDAASFAEDQPIAYRDAPASAVEDEELEIEWSEGEAASSVGPEIEPEAEIRPEPARPAPQPRPQARPARPRPAPPRPQAPARPREEVVAPDRPTITIRRTAGEGLKQWAYRRRHRLAFVGVIALVLVTAGLSLRRRWLEEAPQAIEAARTQGIELLDSGRFDEAHRLLSRGAKAAVSLGGAYQGAEEVRQAAAEAAIFVNLINTPLDEVIDEAARHEPPTDWPRRFRDFYRNQAIVLEARVIEPGRSDRGPVLDFRVDTGRGPQPIRSGLIDTTGLKLFEDVPPRVDDEVVFGARLDSLSPDAEGRWAFRLVPDSGTPITRRAALIALGWPDPAIEAVKGNDNPAPAPSREDGSLRNLTDREVRALLGPPEHRARLATQGQFLEQWSYRGLRGRQVINFRRQAGDLRLVVVSHFDVP